MGAGKTERAKERGFRGLYGPIGVPTELFHVMSLPQLT